MLSKVARNDVVRVTRTGEVGLVKGWADHEKIDENGTIVDVELSLGKTVQANGLALEFVADAKPKFSKAKSAWVLLAALIALSNGVWVGIDLTSRYGMTWWASFSLAVGSTMLVWKALYLLTIRPRKTSIRLPRKQVPHPSVGRPSVHK
ncbi:membrane protein [Streptomyces phage Hiyaa]|uniref:Membrane protein n=1 Tax=Streptomyces phage Hiyaa TaxID=2499072 RepID=A0A3S9U8T5_9CAUD|nr:membrane protein [Streptomyces phage Hiyaa]AZS06726.1 membrane protein [Streptomyces phage Hiyaa]